MVMTVDKPVEYDFKVNDFVKYRVRIGMSEAWKTGYVAEVVDKHTVRVVPDDPNEDLEALRLLADLQPRDYMPGDRIQMRHQGTGTILRVLGASFLADIFLKPDDADRCGIWVSRRDIVRNLIPTKIAPKKHTYAVGDDVEFNGGCYQIKRWEPAKVVEIPKVSATHVKLDKQGWVSVDRIRWPAINQAPSGTETLVGKLDKNTVFTNDGADALAVAMLKASVKGPFVVLPNKMERLPEPKFKEGSEVLFSNAHGTTRVKIVSITRNVTTDEPIYGVFGRRPESYDPCSFKVGEKDLVALGGTLGCPIEAVKTVGAAVEAIKKGQVGGDHYKNMKIQPIEYIMANELGFIEGCVVKYVSRYRVKGGVSDLKKARHFLDILITEKEKKVPNGNVQSNDGT